MLKTALIFVVYLDNHFQLLDLTDQDLTKRKKSSTLGLHVLWKLGQVFTPKRVRAFNPSLHFSAQHLAYRPCAQVPQNKEGPVGLPFSYTKWIATLMFSVTRLKSHSFTRETQTFKEIRRLLGLCPWKDHTNCTPCMRHCPCPLTWFQLFLVMKILAHVHKPRSVKFIVFNGQSFLVRKILNSLVFTLDG
jgi:hypothetical protein